MQDLAPSFRTRAQLFTGELTFAGATVSVTATRRNATRAWLMHYSWRVSRGSIKPGSVPTRPGVDIEWDHGNLNASRKAAQEMVRLFKMKYIASLTSNHISGKAIDMTIHWPGSLLIKVPYSYAYYKIDSEPRDGNNRDLHKVGSLYRVKKLVSDPPHWSYNGR